MSEQIVGAAAQEVKWTGAYDNEGRCAAIYVDPQQGTCITLWGNLKDKKQKFPALAFSVSKEGKPSIQITDEEGKPQVFDLRKLAKLLATVE